MIWRVFGRRRYRLEGEELLELPAGSRRHLDGVHLQTELRLELILERLLERLEDQMVTDVSQLGRLGWPPLAASAAQAVRILYIKILYTRIRHFERSQSPRIVYSNS